jgi:hypothetical protein
MTSALIQVDPPSNPEKYNLFKKRLLIGLLVANVLALIVWRGMVYRNEVMARAAERKTLLINIAEYTRLGVFHGTQGERMVDLLQSTKQSHQISDADLDWLLALMKGSESDASHVGLRTDLATDILAQIKQPTATQKEKIFQTTVWQIQQPDPKGIYLAQVSAMSEFRRLGDKRAFPYIEPFLNHKNPTMRLRAINILRRMGYTKLTQAQLDEAKKLLPRKLPPMSPPK